MSNYPSQPWELSLEEWMDVGSDGFPHQVKADPGNRLLYHRTGNWEAKQIAVKGFDRSLIKSPPAGSIWATRNPDAYARDGAIVVFQVPENDPQVEMVAGDQAIVHREVAFDDILWVDPEVPVAGLRMHRMREGRYIEKWFNWLQEHAEEIGSVWDYGSVKNIGRRVESQTPIADRLIEQEMNKR